MVQGADDEPVEVVATGKKRKFAENEFRKDLTGRQQGWLARHTKVASNLQWRVMKSHRVKSKNWIMNLDNQLRVFKPQGLRLFKPTWGEGNFIDWRTYPWAALPMDFGSDGVCAGHALMYKQDWKLNVDVIGDPLHLDHRAVLGTLRDNNLYGLAHLWLCHCNLLHGPEEDIRYNQFRDHFKVLFDNYTYDKVPLFMAMCGEMAKEFKAHGYEYNAESSEEAQTWAYMKVRAQFARTGKRTTMARFASLAGSLESNFGWWHVQLFDATVVALEEDMLKGKVFVDKFCVKALSDNKEGMNPPE